MSATRACSARCVAVQGGCTGANLGWELVGSIARLRPTPITAQPSCGRASIRIPASFRPSSQTSLGHLIWQLARLQLFSRLANGERDGERQQRWRASRGRRIAE